MPHTTDRQRVTGKYLTSHQNSEDNEKGTRTKEYFLALSNFIIAGHCQLLSRIEFKLNKEIWHFILLQCQENRKMEN